MANNIIVSIELDGKTFESQLKETENKAKASGDKAGKNFGEGIEGKVGSAFGGIATKLAGLAATIGAAFTLKEMIHQAAEGEAALNQFNASLRAAGTFSKSASDDFAAYAATLQSQSTFADDAILKNAATLVSVGRLQGQALKDATKASLDFAVAMDVDVGTAFDVMAKAAAGNVGALGKYGIKVDESVPKSEKFAAALALVNQRFGGFSAAQVNTFSGATAQLSNSFSDLLEEMGKVITSSPLIRDGIKLIAEQIQRATKFIEELASGKDLFQLFAISLGEFGQSVVTYVVSPLELAYNIGQVLFDAFKTGIQFIITVVADLGTRLLAIPAIFSDSAAQIQAGLMAFRDSSAEVLGQFATDTEQSISDATTFNVAATASKNIAAFQEFVAQVRPVAQQVANTLGNAVAPPISPLRKFADDAKKIFLEIAGASDKLGKDLASTFVTGLSNSFAAMGAALVKGQNAFEAFGFALIGVLGDMALKAGAFFIAMGIARAFIPDPSAPAMIAAGVALSVLGGALKAVAGLGGGGAPVAVAPAPPAAGGGGLAASASGDLTPSSAASTDLEEPERRRQNQVIVNIQGNVLDRRETGLEIAQILNDSFNSNGQTIIQGGSFA